MAQNIAQNIANMIECVAGEHCLFRSFGLGGTVDSTNRITRNYIQSESNKWYPSVIIDEVTTKKASNDGSFEYYMKIRGGQNG